MREEQKKRAAQIWQKYVEAGEHLINASQEVAHSELDRQRNAVIPEVLQILERYRSGASQLDEFKTQVDSINKRNRLWGFKGMSGQMFFNRENV
jgi:hypothetical protein